ncbi:MAG: alkaline phosphatase family protein, partial [Flavobacteriales bacterium]|nr:alkaline phosphatase family protein [Flavobacteriales bacterium]
MKPFYLLLIGALGLSLTPLSAQDARLLLIGVDGCRASVLATANTPSLDNLMQTGYYTLNAQTEAPTWSGVGWTAMVTGVWKNKHGVNDNSYIGQNLDYKHFFKYVNDEYPLLSKYSIVHWGPINTHLANFNAGEQQFTYGTDLEVENKVVDVLTNEDPEVIFVHFDDVDHAGHAVGFLSSEPDYVEAIETADARINSILTALYARPDYASENWLIIVSTDHGGNASGHGGATPEERTIFIIAAGAVDDVGEVTLSETNYAGTSHIDLDGSTGAYLNAGDPTGDLVIGSNDFTVECWVKTNGWSGDPSIISNKDWASGFNEGFIIAGKT